MEFRYYKRATLWVSQLIYTLVLFWAKKPKETPAIIKFIIGKGLASPRFFSRNVQTEKHELSFKQKLDNVTKKYQKYSSKLDLSKPKSYEDLENILSSKSELLYFLVRKLKPEVIIETGVAAGESSGYILRAIKDNKRGKLYSIDLPFQWYIYGNHELHLDSLPAGKIPGYLIPEALKINWQLILGDTYIQLPKVLKQFKKIDIFLHDSEHTDKTMTFEYKTSWPYIKKGGLLLSDDIDFTKAFQNFASLKKVKMLEFKNLGVIKK